MKKVVGISALLGLILLGAAMLLVLDGQSASAAPAQALNTATATKAVDTTVTAATTKAAGTTVTAAATKVTTVAQTATPLPAKTTPTVAPTQITPTPAAAKATPTVSAQSTETNAAAGLRYITVVGQGKANLKPDIVTITVGVDTKNTDIKEAMKENETAITAIIAALEKTGIDAKDIQTSNYDIYLDEGMSSSDIKTEPVYRVSNMVTITVRKVDAVDVVLEAAVDAGANRIYGISFDTEDPSAAESEARAKAIENARARAEELASLTGVELGSVLSVSEVIGSSPVVVMDAAKSAAYGMGGATISPGQLEYNISVQVSYAIK